MRIALVTGSLAWGGAESQVVRLAAELRRRGVVVRLFVLDDSGPLRAEVDAAGVEVESWRYDGLIARRPLATAASFVRVARSLRRFRPDVVHAVLPTACLVALPVARALRVPVRIAGLRSTFDPERRSSIRRLHRLADRCATTCLANAEGVADFAVATDGVERGSVHVIENGVDLPPRPVDPGAEPAVCFVVAQLRPEKDHDNLLDALARLPEPPAVHLVGDGPERARLEQRVADLGLGGSVTFEGFVPDASRRFADARFAVLSSFDEGLPNVVLEAMAYGVPSVATDVGGVRELITHDVDGLVVPRRDPAALAEALGRLTSDPDLRRRLGSAARRRAEAFSWERCADRHLALYRELLQAPRRRMRAPARIGA